MTAVAPAGIDPDPLASVNLLQLMEHTSGRADIIVGLLDGPVATGIPSLASENIRESASGSGSTIGRSGPACRHGTFVAAMLTGRRTSRAAAICPGCTLLVRPIFLDASEAGEEQIPQATPEEVATALWECVEAGVHVVNLSVAVVGRSAPGERKLEEALDHAMRQGTLVVAAAGNQRDIGSSAITGHPGVIPVTPHDLLGHPLELSNLGVAIGKRGVGAPGEQISSLTPDGEDVRWTGSSVAAPFVTGTIALIWSEFPMASASAVRFAVTRSRQRRRTIVPPLLDAWAAYLRLQELIARR